MRKTITYCDACKKEIPELGNWLQEPSFTINEQTIRINGDYCNIKCLKDIIDNAINIKIPPKQIEPKEPLEPHQKEKKSRGRPRLNNENISETIPIFKEITHSIENPSDKQKSLMINCSHCGKSVIGEMEIKRYPGLSNNPYYFCRKCSNIPEGERYNKLLGVKS